MNKTLLSAIEGEIVNRETSGFCPTCGGEFIITKSEPIYAGNNGLVEGYWIFKKCPNVRWWHFGGLLGKCWPYYRDIKII